MNKTINRIISMVVAVALTLGVFFSASASSASVPQMAGITYYVAVTGSDLNTCTQAAPCKSFNKAMSLAQAGDVISVMPGTYNQSLVISKSGITVVGNGAVIDTTGTFGIRVASTAQNVVVRGFTVTRTNSHAIYVEGQFVTIENNVVYHSVLENGTLLNGVLSCGNGSWGSAIKVKVGGENVIIRNNEVFDNCGEGIAATRSVNVLIEGNRVYDNHSVNIYVDNSINTQVLNNHSFCANRDTSPIAVGEEYYDGWGAQLRDVVIKDNRIEGCQRAIIVYGSGVGGTLTNVLIDNNIVASGTGTKSVISLDNQSNSNVRITNNQLWKLNIWVRSPSGVTLSNNTSYSATDVTVTATASATPTNGIPTYTPAAMIPTTTNTSTPVLLPPTSTQISTLPASPTIAFTPTAILPTITQTSVPPMVAPSATPLPASPVPTSTDVVLAPSENIFDDKHVGFTYSSGWEDVRKKKAHDGSYKATRKDGDFVIFPFTGQSFSILYMSWSDARKIDVYVDDTLVGTINDKRKGGATPQRWDYSGVLASGAHTLKLVVAGGGTFDAVIVR